MSAERGDEELHAAEVSGPVIEPPFNLLNWNGVLDELKSVLVVTDALTAGVGSG